MDESTGSDSREEGLRLLKSGEVDKAIDVLNRVLEADSDDAKAHMYIAIAYNQKNDKLHSIHHFEESLNLEETPKGYYNLGLVYESVHRTNEAVRQYKMALELDPNYSLAQDAMKKLQDKFDADHPKPIADVLPDTTAEEPAQAVPAAAAENRRSLWSFLDRVHRR